VGDLLDRREKVLEDAPRAQVNLSVDLHAGDEAKLPALALEVAAAQLDLCTIEINRAGFTFSS
jgi:hypothetical protein